MMDRKGVEKVLQQSSLREMDRDTWKGLPENIPPATLVRVVMVAEQARGALQAISDSRKQIDIPKVPDGPGDPLDNNRTLALLIASQREKRSIKREFARAALWCLRRVASEGVRKVEVRRSAHLAHAEEKAESARIKALQEDARKRMVKEMNDALLGDGRLLSAAVTKVTRVATFDESLEVVLVGADESGQLQLKAVRKADERDFERVGIPAWTESFPKPSPVVELP